MLNITDRELVKTYLSQLVSTMSLLGYTGDVSMQTITQLLRQLYKSPAAMDRDLLLNYLVCFALHNPDLEYFEKKNAKFVEECLDHVEQTYTGAKTTTVLRVKPSAEITKQAVPEPDTPKLSADDPNVEKFDLYYFATIEKTGEVFRKNMRMVLPKVDQLQLESAMTSYRNYYE